MPLLHGLPQGRDYLEAALLPERRGLPPTCRTGAGAAVEPDVAKRLARQWTSRMTLAPAQRNRCSGTTSHLQQIDVPTGSEMRALGVLQPLT